MPVSGQCLLSVIPLRSAPKSQSEIVTQLLYGETYTVLEQESDWVKIVTTFDNYTGWISQNQQSDVAFHSESLVTSELFVKYNDQIIPLGGVVENSLNNQAVLGIIPTGMLFLNTPYLWGGRTFMGIDCSGFVQVVHKVNNIKLPRDASQQVHLGEAVSFDGKQPGDLVFFESESGNIHHVGIVLNDTEIIHASGSVRIDTLGASGIIHKSNGNQTHRLHSIKRLR